jgi:hypothetical protein
MGDYDVNTVEMSYRFVVFMALTATLSASMKSAETTVPEESVLKGTGLTDNTIKRMVLVYAESYNGRTETERRERGARVRGRKEKVTVKILSLSLSFFLLRSLSLSLHFK